ncbi:MAG: hypothetical protein JWR55_2309 [Aeromicrobium sp.]|nr:hypothetical protein [Aeromicrobium sp.]
MTAVSRPVAVPELTIQPGARSVASGVRACAVVMSDVGDVMRHNAAPSGFEGDPAETATHAMTSTADDVEAAVAALQVGLAALDAFCDATEGLRSDRIDLVTRHGHLVSAADDLERRAAADPAAGLDGEVSRHNGEVDAFATAVTAWERRITRAEDRLIAALRSADGTSEADRLASDMPDVPRLADDLDDIEGDPVALFAWWKSLTRAEREALKIARPELIGNTDGIPIVDRDEANRAELSALHNTLEQRAADDELTDADRELQKKIDAIRQGLDKAEDQLDENGDPLPTYLMGFDPDAADGDGHAAIAFGNPETADHVSVNVPGLDSTMDTFDGVSGDAAAVRESAARNGDGSVASIAWLGYDAPDFDASVDGIRDGLGVAGETRAAAGARNLSDFVDGLRATRQGDDPAHYTVIGHSYGSVTVGKAAGGDMHVDDVVLVGSPGPGDENPHASDLHGRVYVGSSDEDFVTHLGSTDDKSLGVDPANEDFGGTRFRVEPQGEFGLDGDGLDAGIENHTSYFDDADQMSREHRGDQDSDSLINVGKIVAGRGDTVDQVSPRTEDNDAWWIKQAGHSWLDRVLHRGG